MIRDLVRNGSFANMPAHDQTPKRFAEICDGWFIEFTGNPEHLQLGMKPLEGSKAGLSLQVREGRSWVRLWQPIDLTAALEFRTLRLQVRARRTPGATDAPRLLWGALLQKDETGKRVFAKGVLNGPFDVTEEWSVFAADIAVASIPDAASLLAIQFGDRFGSIDIEGIALIGDPKRVTPAAAPPAPVSRVAPPPADRAAPPAAPAKPAPRAPQAPALGGFLAWQGRTLIGWTRRPPSTEEVQITVNGRGVGHARLTALPKLRGIAVPVEAESGFSFEMPARMLDGTEHAVTIRDTQRGHRLFKAMLRTPAIETIVGNSVIAITDTGDPAGSGDGTVRGSDRSAASAEAGAPAPLDHAAVDAASRQRCCVVSWDMAHNPVGRAYLLADMAARFAEVELVGPIFSRYGDRIWPPIADLDMRMRSFNASDMESFLKGAVALAETVKCDVVHVGKARLPSLILGALIRHHNNCRMIVDVDDHELSFFAERSQASLTDVAAGSDAEVDSPFSELWTRHAETLVAAADGVTVSNYHLQRRFGGIVVRHGRDERHFDPKLYDRAATRAAFGYGPTDRVVLFLGTPRPHKGVFTIADAMETIGDDRLALCVIGSITDRRVSNRFAGYTKARIALHPDQPWERLPELVAMADAVFLLQDPGSAIAEYQIPAKLTDALALGVPCYATPVPPLADLIAAGGLIPIDDDAALETALRGVAEGDMVGVTQERARGYYLSELSYEVNAARLRTAYSAAVSARQPAMPAFDALFDMLEERTGIILPRFAPRRRAPAVWRKTPPDVVFLWKQNDSDIYGRRSDMVAKYLLQSGKVGRVIHFDAPISANDLQKQLQHGPDAAQHQGNLVYQNTMRRVLRSADTPRFLRRTFLYRTGRQAERLLNMDLRPFDAHADFIKETLQEAGVSASPLLWVCPVVFDYAAVRAAVRPSLTVADIIDDQRSFAGSDLYRKRVKTAYETILGSADLVIGNCEAVQTGFAPIRPDIEVVPNGAEVFDLSEAWPVPEELKHLPRPIFGYVGNLRDRVDFDLIRKTAEQNAHGSVVVIGSAHGRPEALELGRAPNVHLLGVRPYPEAVRFIRAFDVAIMPHLRNALSENMNPLKLYVYFALGVPIVTTEVANIGDIAPFAAVADTHEAFLEATAAAAAGHAVKVTDEERRAVLAKVSWETRVNSIFRILDF